MMAKSRSPIPCAEHAGVTALYLENHMWLRRWLAYRLQPAAACVADDLAQDVFLRILSSRNRFQIDSIRQPRVSDQGCPLHSGQLVAQAVAGACLAGGPGASA